MESNRMPNHETINYVEFPSRDLAATKAFFEECFGWSFMDYGPDYAAFSTQEMCGPTASPPPEVDWLFKEDHGRIGSLSKSDLLTQPALGFSPRMNCS